MNLNIEIYNYLSYFIIYSFWGWLIESVYAKEWFALIKKNYWFLYWPFRPIYWIWALIIILAFSKFESNIYMLFLGWFFIVSFFEYLVWAFLENYMNKKLWTYEAKKFNIKWRICLEVSIAWWIITIILLKYFHPFLDMIITKADSNITNNFVNVFIVYFIFDFICVLKTDKNVHNFFKKSLNYFTFKKV